MGWSRNNAVAWLVGEVVSAELHAWPSARWSRSWDRLNPGLPQAHCSSGFCWPTVQILTLAQHAHLSQGRPPHSLLSCHCIFAPAFSTTRAQFGDRAATVPNPRPPRPKPTRTVHARNLSTGLRAQSSRHCQDCQLTNHRQSRPATTSVLPPPHTATVFRHGLLALFSRTALPSLPLRRRFDPARGATQDRDRLVRMDRGVDPGGTRTQGAGLPLGPETAAESPLYHHGEMSPAQIWQPPP